jgi:hypothetical protein
MTYFADLSPCTYFHHFLRPSGRLLAVGWLDDSHPFPRGPVKDHTLSRLALLVQPPWPEPDQLSDDDRESIAMGAILGPWEPVFGCGYHDCEICNDANDLARRGRGIVVDGRSIKVGAFNLFVPGVGVVYLAPSLILHYIKDHEYLPPTVFLEAVDRCPPMHSSEYRQLIIANGPSDFGSPTIWGDSSPPVSPPSPASGWAGTWQALRAWFSAK